MLVYKPYIHHAPRGILIPYICGSSRGEELGNRYKTCSEVVFEFFWWVF
jgi:hypothetical protein